jgi:hypothetical protein
MYIPNEVIKFINVPLENVVIKEFSFKKSKDIDDVVEMVMDVILPKINEFYEPIESRYRFQNIYKMLAEPMKNANFYSSNDSHPLNVNIFMYPTGFVSSLCDGGIYFTNSEVKKSWESRKNNFESFTPSIKGLGGGCGKMFIFELMDFIFVDNENNKLYTGITTKNKTFF